MPRREMDAIDIAEFLRGRMTGVLGLAREDDAYALPLSFTYDEDEQAFYFRLGFGPDSQKREFVEATDWATFAVYDDTDEGWQSVLAEGHLAVLTDDVLDASLMEAVKQLAIPYFDVHGRPSHELDFEVARLEATKLTGIVEG